MKTLPIIFPILALLAPPVLADFSNAQVELHPRYPAQAPFIVEINGVWPSDCHPGEQKPVVTDFDGLTVEIEFDIIVQHITCNITDTPYRVLVDVNDVIRTDSAISNSLNVVVRFDGATLQQSFDLVCPQDADCLSSTANLKRPEQGLYASPGLASQGLLVSWQNAATAIFPLVYDQEGRSEWLFSSNLMVEDSFFAEILLPSGGDCFACEPTDSNPQLEAIGQISVLVDSPGVLQVKVNDGLFTEYTSLVYGHRKFQIDPESDRTFVDLEGRWAISENRGTNPPLGDLTEFLPAAFDLVREDKDTLVPPTEISYLVTSLTDEVLGQLICTGEIGFDGKSPVCDFIDPTDAAEPLLRFFQQGPSSLSIEYGRAVIAVGTAPGGKAVRIN